MKRQNPRRIRIAIAAFFMLLTIACFVAGNEQFAQLMSMQPGALLIRAVAGLDALSIVLGIALLMLTLLFGRFFCAAVCPLGILQDVLGVLGKKRNRSVKMGNYKVFRYTILALSLVLLAGGWAILLRFLDPFSRFGGMLAGTVRFIDGEAPSSVAPFLVGALLPFACLAALVVWKRRVYCVEICPIGTMLGLFSRYGVWQMRMNRSCTACGRCEQVCPAGCIESRERKVDNERCVRCMNCLAQCPGEGISLSRRPEKELIPNSPVDPSRRTFIAKGAAFTLGAVTAGHFLGAPIRSFARANRTMEGAVLPPGAMSTERFMAICTSCQLCTLNCPSGVIQPSPYALGPVHLEFDHGACHHDCSRCNAICPSGALQPMTLEDKQWLKIGEAFCEDSKCRAIKENVACYICSKICPKGAIFMREATNGLEVPEVSAFHCIGCGACQSVCPMTPKAITVTGVEQSVMGFGS